MLVLVVYKYKLQGFFFLQNNTYFQIISLVSKVSKLFRKTSISSLLDLSSLQQLESLILEFGLKPTWNSSFRDSSSRSCKDHVPVLPSFFFLQTKSRIQKILKPKGSAMEVQKAEVEIGPLSMVAMIVGGKAKEARPWKFGEQREWKFSTS